MTSVDKRNELLQINDIKDILKSEHGRRFMWRVLCYCGIYRDVEGDQVDIFKQLGRRQVGLYILALLSSTDDEQVSKMMLEAKNKEKEDDYSRREEQDRIDGESGDSGEASHDYRGGNALNEYV